jgi:hypothetical protein
LRTMVMDPKNCPDNCQGSVHVSSNHPTLLKPSFQQWSSSLERQRTMSYLPMNLKERAPMLTYNFKKPNEKENV